EDAVRRLRCECARRDRHPHREQGDHSPEPQEAAEHGVTRSGHDALLPLLSEIRVVIDVESGLDRQKVLWVCGTVQTRGGEPRERASAATVYGKRTDSNTCFAFAGMS